MKKSHPSEARRKRAVKKAGARRSIKKSLTYNARKNDVVSNLVNNPTGLTLGILLRGEKVEAKKEISRLLAIRAKKKMAIVLNTREENERGVLKMARMELYGNDAFVLMDSGDIPNVFSKEMSDRQCVTPDKANRTIKVSKGVRNPVVGSLESLPVAFDEMAVKL